MVFKKTLGQFRCASVLVVVLMAASPARSATVYGITTDHNLIRFNSSNPGNTSTVGSVSGLGGGEILVGIDFRPANGALYGVSNLGSVFTVDTSTGAATKVGLGNSFSLIGSSFGVDFNPTVDLIRVVSHAGQNLRVRPGDGTLRMMDSALNPGTPNIVAVGYTNSFRGATSTELFGIDSATNQLFKHIDPNGGTLELRGSLGLDIGDVAGFDILARDGTAFAGFNLPGVSNTRLYTVDLASGAASLVGNIGSSGVTLASLAVQPVPEPGTIALFGAGFIASGSCSQAPALLANTKSVSGGRRNRPSTRVYKASTTSCR